jgi:uncharacterized phage-associated protein
MCYSKDTIDKIGNAIIYLSERIPDLSKTKLLKLLYLVEEISVIKNKIPFFGVDFQVWQAGPVPREIYVDLSEDLNLLGAFVEKTVINGDSIYIKGKSGRPFNDDEFSDADIAVMEDVISRYGNKTAKELVKILHKKGSAWYNLAQKNNLLDGFNRKKQNTSNIDIDFTYYLSGCGSEFYRETTEIRNHFEKLNSRYL